MESLTEPISPEATLISSPPKFRELVQKKLEEAKKQKEQMIRSTDSLSELALSRDMKSLNYERERKLLVDMLTKSQQTASIVQMTYETEKQKHSRETQELINHIELLEEENRLLASREFEIPNASRTSSNGITSDKLIEELRNLEKVADHKEKFYKEELDKFKQELKSRDEKIKFLTCENDILLDDINKTARRPEIISTECTNKVSVGKFDQNRRNLSKPNTPVHNYLSFTIKSKPATPTKIVKELNCEHDFEVQSLKAMVETLKEENKKLEKDQINLMKISNERESNLTEEIERLRVMNNKLVEINQTKEQTRAIELEKLTDTIREMQQSFNTSEILYTESQDKLKKENQNLKDQIEDFRHQKDQLKIESFSYLKDEIKALRESQKVLSSLPIEKDENQKSKLKTYRLKVSELESNIRKLKDYYVREKNFVKSELKHRAEIARKESSQISAEIETLAKTFSGNDIVQVFLEELKKYEDLDLAGLVMLSNELCEQRNWEQQMLLNMANRIKEGPKGLYEDLEIYLHDKMYNKNIHA